MHLQRGQRKCGDKWVLWTPAAFAWQVQHLEHLRLVLRCRRSTCSTSVWFCVAGAALGAPPQRSAEVRRQVSTMDAGCFCVAGAALGAPQARFAWQAQHLQHLPTEVGGSPATSEYYGRQARFAWQVQHWKHLSCVLRGISLKLKPSTQHHLHYIIKHNIINTHRLHYIINTTSSTQPHQHITI